MDNNFIRIVLEDKDGKTDVLSSTTNEDSTWNEVLEVFFRVLLGHGYSIDEEKIQKILSNIE